MNLMDEKYSKYALVTEMMESLEIVRNYDSDITREVSQEIMLKKKVLLTGEGSSRIFPAKNIIRKSHCTGSGIQIFTEGSRQAYEYCLKDTAVFCASNSGKTKEVVLLAKHLKKNGNENRYALTANSNTMLEQECNRAFVLNCGWEKAVAATKSVVEQALFYDSLLTNIERADNSIDYNVLSEKMGKVLTMPIDPDVVKAVSEAATIYFAGYNDGVAEELTLKTNEITRKKSDYLEGTYAVHGIEEILDSEDVVILVDPIEDEIEKFDKVLRQGVGLKIIAISTYQTPFPTILIPEAKSMSPYLFLCAGWNLLVEVGIHLGIDLDKPVRARKVGNELVI